MYKTKSLSLLENDGNGKFRINNKITFKNQGMVTDAIWVDIDNDGWTDLFLCGDWSDIKFYKNIQGNLIEDDKKFAQLHNGKVFERFIPPLAMDADASVRNAMFQYMIGNTDFSTAYQHNNKLLYIDWV